MILGHLSHTRALAPIHIAMEYFIEPSKRNYRLQRNESVSEFLGSLVHMKTAVVAAAAVEPTSTAAKITQISGTICLCFLFF